MKKIIKISTVPQSLSGFLKDQIIMLSDYYEVLAISSPGKDLDLLEKEAKIKTLPVQMERHISIFRDIKSLCQLIRIFAKEKPDAVHSITPKAGLLAMLAAWITRVPVRIHTFTGLVFPTSKGLKQKILMLTDRITCFCATYINPEGNGVKSDLINYRITSKDLHIIANGNVRGIDLTFYSRTEQVLKDAIPYINSNVLTFCFVGRIVKDKGIEELVTAFDKLSISNKGLRLFLIGPYEQNLDPISESVLNVINSNDAITVFGRQDDVRPFLVASDVFILPSYREGFPNSVIEAGAMGLPSIVTNVNGSNEIIIEGVNGEIIPAQNTDALYSKMLDWIKNPQKISTYARASRPLIKKRYDQHIVWKALLKVYNDII